ncbi:peptide/nickel transport system permease protein [Sanguibacter gelidistatuariae]|uniref:Peptide/nickel transport system permease protein n=1 Tax=Sanguibacter gelidistatuariae TaxID=1814289 RepID=A0A1G6RQX7_9MICO|nr:ABC transporter permease [Sanguibacter gelidistatuariae]SDD06948.1 peptide/nickel transport system permease protein [Sanguibacter gelidistatuariae]
MSIFRWAAGRLGAAALVAWVVTTVVFFALRAAGGDPTEAILGGPGSQAGEDAVAQARSDYGLDRPLIVQYLVQMRRILTFQLGDSYARKQPVAELIGAQLGSTMLLAVCALALAWVIALSVATLATRAQGVLGRVVSGLVQAGEVTATVMPHFWLGAVLILVFSSTLGWFPATSVGASPAGLVLPVVTLAIPTAGFLGQVMRDGLDEAAASPFATTARARGASESRILWRHSLRHAALPAISLSGWSFGSLLSGAVVVESLFGRPGLGRLLLDATSTRDVPVVVGSVLVVALTYTVVTTMADGVERLVDPRPRGADRATDRTLRAEAAIV